MNNSTQQNKKITPIFDLEDLLEEVQDRIEEKIAIEGGNTNEK